MAYKDDVKKYRSKFKVAIVQLDVGPDKTDNLRRATLLADTAAKDGASIICLPELFNYMGPMKDPRDLAEDEGGPSIMFLREIAVKYSKYIVAGSIFERAKGKLPLNTCFLIGPDGKIVSKYSKMHLFDIHIPNKIHFHESNSMQAGKYVAVAETAFGKVGFAICNDLRYPEMFRKMVAAGARIIFVPSAFTKFTGREHWFALTRVRAIENQCYIVAVNQSGKNADNVHFFGSSLVCDPWGNIVAEAPAKGDALIMVNIDLKKVDTLREQLPALKKIRFSYPLKNF